MEASCSVIKAVEFQESIMVLIKISITFPTQGQKDFHHFSKQGNVHQYMKGNCFPSILEQMEASCSVIKAVEFQESIKLLRKIPITFPSQGQKEFHHFSILGMEKSFITFLPSYRKGHPTLIYC